VRDAVTADGLHSRYTPVMSVVEKKQFSSVIIECETADVFKAGVNGEKYARKNNSIMA